METVAALLYGFVSIIYANYYLYFNGNKQGYYSYLVLTAVECLSVLIFIYSKISQLRPLEIKTTSLFRPLFVSPKWYFSPDIAFDIKTSSLIRPHLSSPKGGLNIGILLYFIQINLQSGT